MLREHGARKTFEIIGSGLSAFIEHAVLQTLPYTTRQSLRATAKQLSAELDRWCTEQIALANDTATTAIVGLSFSFASARRGLGCLSESDMARCQSVLNATSPPTVRKAIEMLLESGLLQREDCDLVRYTPSVSRLFREIIENDRSLVSHTMESPAALTSH